MKTFFEVRADYGTPESVKILKKETPGQNEIEEKPYLRTHHKLKNLKVPVTRKKGKIIKPEFKLATATKEDKDPSEYDEEGLMMKDQLDIVMDAADEIYDMVDDNENLPEWCQNKITKAADYVDSVRDYLMSQNTDKDNKDE